MTFQNEEHEKIPVLKRHMAIPRTPLEIPRTLLGYGSVGMLLDSSSSELTLWPQKLKLKFSRVKSKMDAWGKLGIPSCLELFKQNRATQRILQ